MAKKNANEGSVYKDGNIEIRRNHCKELFIKDVKSGVEIRLSSHLGGRGLEFTNWGGTPSRVTPVRIANGIGWAVVPSTR